MLEFQQDNQFFLFNLTEKPTEPALFFESAFWEKQQRITGSAKGRGTTYFLDTKDSVWCKLLPFVTIIAVVYGENLTKIAIVFNHLLKLAAWRNFSC